MEISWRKRMHTLRVACFVARHVKHDGRTQVSICIGQSQDRTSNEKGKKKTKTFFSSSLPSCFFMRVCVCICVCMHSTCADIGLSVMPMADNSKSFEYATSIIYWRFTPFFFSQFLPLFGSSTCRSICMHADCLQCWLLKSIFSFSVPMTQTRKYGKLFPSHLFSPESSLSVRFIRFSMNFACVNFVSFDATVFGHDKYTKYNICWIRIRFEWCSLPMMLQQ